MKTTIHQRVAGPHRAFSLLIFLLLALFLAVPAYACHQGKPHGRDKTPCRNLLEGIESFNMAEFADDYVDTFGEILFRRQDSATVQAGDYTVFDDPGPIEIATDNLSRLADSKSNAGMCGLMDTADPLDPIAKGPFVSAPDVFSYGWSDDCTDGSCAVEVSLSFSGPDVVALTGGKSDQMTLVMYGGIDGAEDVLEPFLDSNKISISALVATYNRIGTARTLVTCQFAPQGYAGPLMYTTPE